MNEADLADLVTTIADRLCGKHEHICVALIRQLAAGQPVSLTHLAADIAMKEPTVRAVLQQMLDVDYDGTGNVVGFGLSLVPTAHQLMINGHFFASAATAATWLHDHPDGIILPVTDAHRLGRLLADRRMFLARQQGAVCEATRNDGDRVDAEQR
jgi:hypothetical protein